MPPRYTDMGTWVALDYVELAERVGQGVTVIGADESTSGKPRRRPTPRRRRPR